MIANCDKNSNVLKYTYFPTQNGLIYTNFSINILRTQNTALGTWRGCKYCSGSYFLFKSNSDFKRMTMISMMILNIIVKLLGLTRAKS